MNRRRALTSVFAAAATGAVGPGALEAQRIRAAGFPIARYADDAEGSAILDAWGAAGHIIGNHTWGPAPTVRHIEAPPGG